MNSVADEAKAVKDLTRNVPFGRAIAELFEEFSDGKTVEALLAHDADQLALILELKALYDLGYDGPDAWLPHVVARVQTEVGQNLVKRLMKTPSDAWWFEERQDGV